MKNLNEAIIPAISAGLGAVMLRNKIRRIQEGGEYATYEKPENKMASGDGGSTINMIGNDSGSYAEYEKPSKTMAEGDGGSTLEMKGNAGIGSRKVRENVEVDYDQKASSPASKEGGSTLVGIPNMGQ